MCYFERGIKPLVWPLVIVFCIGLGTEIIGVNTGYLFGDYEYHQHLGLKCFGVPLTIGALWLSLSIGVKNLVGRFLKHKLIIAGLSAIVMVGFDYLMEPIAIQLNYWNWSGEQVPFYNYFTWFLVSLVIQLILIQHKTTNRILEIIFLIQVLFFVCLNILL